MKIGPYIGNSWDALLRDEFQKPYYQKLRHFLAEEYGSRTVYPPPEKIFRALSLTAYEDVKVVILGQDPYHEPGQAEGLCFSVAEGTDRPPSLLNIFREIKDETGLEIPPSGESSLLSWAEQGVLLLNTCLTVREHQANSHRGKGWEILTDRIIEILSARPQAMVFILWGRNARMKKKLIDPRHLILEGAHPSPLSAYNGFFGGNYFVRANAFLTEQGRKPINWDISKIEKGKTHVG